MDGLGDHAIGELMMDEMTMERLLKLRRRPGLGGNGGGRHNSAV